MSNKNQKMINKGAENLEEEKKKCCCPMPPPPPPPYPGKGPVPPYMTVNDWITYINSYIDVRARQLYDKLKKLIEGLEPGEGGFTPTAKDYIMLRDGADGHTYYVYMKNGVLMSDTRVPSS